MFICINIINKAGFSLCFLFFFKSIYIDNTNQDDALMVKGEDGK